ARFPIRRLQPVSAYRGSDDASMAADNTSGFNCRFVGGTSRWSMHAYGEAIDVNPVENPYVHGGRISPPAGRAYADRSRDRAGMSTRGGVLVRAFASVGWNWGAGFGDYQHFSTTGR
ncbi:MAG TPA: M15 family metallopeptidase, partial [Gaiellaceae bacterium]|nr:M15 family metallopeptidase [Gaiellaceae bacterium]